MNPYAANHYYPIYPSGSSYDPYAAMATQYTPIPYYQTCTSSHASQIQNPGLVHRVPCLWGGGTCSIMLDDVSAAGIMRHLRVYHLCDPDRPWDKRARGVCEWGGDCGKEMAFASYGKHVAAVHLRSRVQCPYCYRDVGRTTVRVHLGSGPLLIPAGLPGADVDPVVFAQFDVIHIFLHVTNRQVLCIDVSDPKLAIDRLNKEAQFGGRRATARWQNEANVVAAAERRRWLLVEGGGTALGSASYRWRLGDPAMFYVTVGEPSLMPLIYSLQLSERVREGKKEGETPKHYGVGMRNASSVPACPP
ncbi:hypothetical protein POSPLADRAFT_1045678 [Postia placenta MAD-698-R-SB12]|uniref:Uncharacterized protein n=1 Tax=Postia placenta MAD-698-R-SB12 TaxID=670580 RepID=A0A1X6N3U1_9APHY|nr:hypothetical protein POSPLADRAFT_1045678 [Postia placenta MAD-698-R-SB12]OSX63309.1 hypothetical protein POSPLADRAFT_1045678 [Postia placenta MAD-698-R-SB12]